MAEFSKIYTSKGISIETKLRVLNVSVVSVLISCSRYMDIEEERQGPSVQTKCLREILNIRWQQKIRNGDETTRIGVARDRVQKMKKELNLFGNLCKCQMTDY